MSNEGHWTPEQKTAVVKEVFRAAGLPFSETNAQRIGRGLRAIPDSVQETLKLLFPRGLEP